MLEQNQHKGQTMQKEFNDTGLCIPHKHYMVDTTSKLKKVITLIEKGKYFTINRPRQFGKTTTIYLLDKLLNSMPNYLAIRISFEGIGDDPFATEESFCPAFLRFLAQRLRFTNPDLVDYLEQGSKQVNNFETLSGFISQYVKQADKQIVILIDEVDKSSNHHIFLNFLAMLRNKYLNRDDGEDTFQAVILAGVHDIKTLKSKIRPNETKNYNSPWNIAIDFEVDLSFAPLEIETMLQDYAQDKQIEMDKPAIAQKLYYYTSGYPFLVSKLCKFIDEKIIPPRPNKNWTLTDVETAFTMIVDDAYTTTLFDSLAKNLENNPDLYEFVAQIVINGQQFSYVITNPIVNLGHLYGILTKSETGRCQIHNRIFEQRIYAHMLLNLLQTTYRDLNSFGGPEFYTTKGLDVKLILQRFQAFMNEHYSDRDAKFLEREGRFIFLAYLKPILNGRGFEFKEPVVDNEQRMDIVITYQNKRYVLELKRWYGKKYHQQGLEQLSKYLDSYGLKEGYLLIYDFNKNKQYKEEQIQFQDKQIFAVWV